MAEASACGGHETGFAANTRQDLWWVGPLLTFLGLSTFIVYGTWAAFQGNHYYIWSYLSPFYSPVIFLDPSVSGAADHSILGAFPSWWPAFIPQSPSFLILVFPGVFRFTCYYYRKAYYRSFPPFAPPGCGVTALAQKKYKGETCLLLIQNLHRYALYCALVFIVILYYDAFAALRYKGQWGIGVGTVVLFINATLLACYTLGCHSLRHLVGGRLNCFSCSSGCEVRHGLWKKVTWLNQRHMLFAWMSLFWVGFTDVYVRLVSLGHIIDFNTWN